jgi:hypothetical protein
MTTVQEVELTCIHIFYNTHNMTVNERDNVLGEHGDVPRESRTTFTD